MNFEEITKINNLPIRHDEIYGYTVWHPDGYCLIIKKTLEEAEDFCDKYTDEYVPEEISGKHRLSYHYDDFVGDFEVYPYIEAYPNNNIFI